MKSGRNRNAGDKSTDYRAGVFFRASLRLPRCACILGAAQRGDVMLKKILVVEDNEDNRRILVYRLRKIGQFDIREAANGLQAIEAVQHDPPDLIFMDLKMPVMDGWEATRRIRQMDVGQSVRIIALTAQAMAGDEQKALSIGCDDYLAKPVVDPDIVRQKLERLIGAAGAPCH